MNSNFIVANQLESLARRIRSGAVIVSSMDCVSDKGEGEMIVINTVEQYGNLQIIFKQTEITDRISQQSKEG